MLHAASSPVQRKRSLEISDFVLEALYFGGGIINLNLLDLGRHYRPYSSPNKRNSSLEEPIDIQKHLK
eukprot:scaffold54848_cov46-Attheya_sp.AAC.6